MWIKTFENYNIAKDLIIVDVQKSFRPFFTEMYINELTKYCNNFENVYYVFDNHPDGKNVDKDYLYDENPEIPVSDEFYNFPNVKEKIEKRYNYDVDADFYKKILDKDIYKKISDMEEQKTLKKGDMFPTKEGTVIVYIGNNHTWFHVPKKLYEVLKSVKGKTVEVVGGAENECILDVITTGQSIGANMKPNYKYIWSSVHCPIK
jgi:hypothetical protein